MRGARLVLGSLLGLLAVAPARAGERPAVDFADPFVARDGDAYFAFATSARGAHVQVSRSRDLRSWAELPDALPVLPRWAASKGALTWAPSVLRRPHGWVLYFTTSDAASGLQCISRATSTSVAGPYADDSAGPFVCQTQLCGSIDPSPFVDAHGAAWLLWKSDENASACRGSARIWSQRLSEDGLSLTGDAHPLLTADQAWEKPLVEGPSMVQSADATYLFYSAAWYDSADYAIGYARCEGPSGPCKKATSTQPFLKSAGRMLGPGGQEFFSDASGGTWMAFHAWTAPLAGYAAGGVRSLRLARLSFADGVPMIMR
jgi:beta-xylosidase